jgi:2,3-diketo-5-methylthio-1-phosphopentane phosphatase
MISVTPKEFDEFLKQQTIDSSFVHFVDYCKDNNYPISILSDGMDIYIKPILKWNHLDQLSVYSNELRWDGGDKLVANFPFFDHTCGHCANCKGYQIRRLRKPNEHIIFIGDGYSDICGIKEADTIFAKDALSNYCVENKIPYIGYKSFKDVMNWFKQNL